jgi:hypothetical protein
LIHTPATIHPTGVLPFPGAFFRDEKQGNRRLDKAFCNHNYNTVPFARRFHTLFGGHSGNPRLGAGKQGPAEAGYFKGWVI